MFLKFQAPLILLDECLTTLWGDFIVFTRVAIFY